jgi:hypothetical protein
MIENRMKDYISKFWVGLMDGDGSIQVNHWRKKHLQYRFVIKCVDSEKNREMIHSIKKHLGGNLRIDHKRKTVLWVCDQKKHIRYLLSTVFQKYPPLTSRLNAQLVFLNQCLKNQEENTLSSQDQILWYLENRNLKYSLYEKQNTLHQQPLACYFPEWCSGFIEAEGCFSIRNTSKNHSFSLGQKKDKYLLQQIKEYFLIQSQLRNPKNDFWVLETYRRETFLHLANHFKNYPLLGAKSQSYQNFLSVVDLSHRVN